MKKRKRKKQTRFEKVLQSIHNSELLDLETLELRIVPFGPDVETSLTCDFNGFYLRLQPTKNMAVLALIEEPYASGRITKAEFQLGYNPATGKPQIAWKKQPKDFELKMAVDVLVGLLVAIVKDSGFDPAMLLPKLKVRT